MTKLLVIDNYDSFVYTLNGYLQQLGATTVVVRNDAIPPEDLAGRLADYDGLVISPGPGTPANAGVSIAAIRLAAAAGQPMVGVCLGHQALAEAYGATVSAAEELMHGKVSQVVHEDVPFFAGVPHEFAATRYHSLAVVASTMPDCLEVTARTPDGTIMACQHRELPLYGVQFHPESVMTEGGYTMLGNWLALAGLPEAVERATHLHPLLDLDREGGASRV